MNGMIESACWKHIGVWGNESPRCKELEQVVHCRNCRVFTHAGRELLERDLPEGYMDEWTALLASEKVEAPSGATSVVLFRLDEEWLALKAQLFSEIIEPQTPHTIPNRTSPVLKGIVNVHGELQVCVSLSALLELGEPRGAGASPKARGRMVVVEKQGERWVFPVDEVHGIHRVTGDAFENVPVTVAKGPSTCTRAIFRWRDQRVALLDDELLFYKMARSVR